MDLKEERLALRDALIKMSGMDFVGMEDWGASASAPMDFCLDRVSDSDLYIGIFSHRYGWVDPVSDRSITELEYRRAQRDHKPCLIYIHQAEAPTGVDPRLLALKEELLRHHTVGFFRTPQDLATRVTIDLHNHLGQTPRIEAPAVDSAAKASRKNLGLIPTRAIAVLAATLLALAAGTLWVRMHNPAGQRGIAVLPLGGASGDERALGRGVAVAMTSQLASQPGFQKRFWVVPASDVLHEKAASAVDAGRAFGVDLAVSGVVQMSGDTVRVTASVSDVRTSRQLGSRTIERAAGARGALQDEVVKAVAGMLEVEPSQGTAVQDPATESDYLQGAGLLAGGLAQADAAIAAFRSALARNPEFAAAHAGLGQAFLNKFSATRDRAWIDKAKASCREAIRRGDASSAPLLTLGMAARAEGRYEEAISRLREAVSRSPGDPSGWDKLGRTYEASNRFPDAEAAFVEAVRLQPDNSKLHFRLGGFYYQRGQAKQALDSLERARALAPDNHSTYSLLGAAYGQLGSYRQAEEALKHSIALKPNAAGYINLCAEYLYQERYKEAAPLCEKAVGMGDAVASDAGNAAYVYRLAGDTAKSRMLFQKALDAVRRELATNPRNAESRADLAWLLALTGDAAGAVGEIESARDQAPGNTAVLYAAVLVFELTGNRERAIAALSALASVGGSIGEIRRRPELKAFRADPKLKEVPEWQITSLK